MTTTLGATLSQIPAEASYQQKLENFIAIVEGAYAYPYVNTMGQTRFSSEQVHAVMRLEGV